MILIKKNVFDKKFEILIQNTKKFIDFYFEFKYLSIYINDINKKYFLKKLRIKLISRLKIN